jgi:hypothetical protein
LSGKIEPTAEEQAAFTAAVDPVLARHRRDFDPALFASPGGEVRSASGAAFAILRPHAFHGSE